MQRERYVPFPRRLGGHSGYKGNSRTLGFLCNYQSPVLVLSRDLPAECFMLISKLGAYVSARCDKWRDAT
ncbi:hypothetical protein AOQ71_12280 [Bradyrhizobium manausense]|uniref:Uncharacterized protein n=1 Tax=Bradyrhizobium manausense TaxID=989370 RepID=A0A0R3E3S8_9BRAD|nr:hypothetical protein AOQ71_12280 [Bradyrhizobium manausense]